MRRTTLAISVLTLVMGGQVFADDKAHGQMQNGKMMKDQGAMKEGKPMDASQHSGEMTEGEVTRISKGSKKLTMKHGEIKNLEMPPMTMVFNVSDEKMLDRVSKGDKVRFRAESIDGQMVVTELIRQ